MAKATSVLALCALLVACGPDARDGDDDGNGGSGNGSSDCEVCGVPEQCKKMDIVFVVDNSGSMQEEQTNLAANFPMFAQLLEQYQVTANGEPLDFRVALTTTGRDIMYQIDLGGGFGTFPQNEMGQNGVFYDTCGVNKRWLDRSDPTMAQALACRANVGTMGPSMEMPLLMSKWALKERAADTNAGFVRPDALLAVVMLTDEDDSSTTDNNFTVTATGSPPTNWHPADQVMFLDGLKGNRTRWASAVIAGDGNCSSSFGNAADAIRLKEFVSLANGNSTQAVFSSICNGDLTKGLKDALDLFQAACGAIIL
jgi:hypothetical protein